MPNETAGPYRVVRDYEPPTCPCICCASWWVVGPDGIALGQSWIGSEEAEDAAKDKADDMNIAHAHARRECAEELEALMALHRASCLTPAGNLTRQCVLLTAIDDMLARWRS